MSRKGKYIIEIAERHTHYTDEGKAYNLYRVKGFNTLTFDDNGLKKLEKYTDNRLQKLIRESLDEKQAIIEKALDIACSKLAEGSFFTKEEMKLKILSEVSK